MNLLQLVFKQMRERALSSWLTMLSVLLGVALWVAISILNREGDALFGQHDYGYDLLVGKNGSPLQLVMNSVYHLDKSPGNIPYSMYEDMVRPDGPYRQYVKIAVPTAVGDTYKGLRIVGAPPKLFGFTDEGKPANSPFEYRLGKSYQIAQGKLYAHNRFEAVIGSEVPKLVKLKLGDTFQATHGNPSANEKPDIHEEKWTVVGVMAPTHTAADKCIYIPLDSFYCIFEHEDAMKAIAAVKAGEDPTNIANQSAATKPDAHDDHGHDHDHDHDHDEAKQYTMNDDGTFTLTLPKDKWLLSSIFVRSRSGFAGQQLMWTFANRNEAMAVNPASVMREFFDTFLAPYGTILQIVSYLVLVVASVSILVSIYNSISARKREIAILRALGATKLRIVGMICTEAAAIGLFGGVLGLVAGHAIAAAGSVYLQGLMGEGLNWASISTVEWIYLICVVALAGLAGLVPALKAYTTPVATNLVAG